MKKESVREKRSFKKREKGGRKREEERERAEKTEVQKEEIGSGSRRRKIRILREKNQRGKEIT